MSIDGILFSNNSSSFSVEICKMCKERDGKYDVKVFENNEEMETIRDLKYSQMIAITKILKRHNISYIVKECGSDE